MKVTQALLCPSVIALQYSTTLDKLGQIVDIFVSFYSEISIRYRQSQKTRILTIAGVDQSHQLPWIRFAPYRQLTSQARISRR